MEETITISKKEYKDLLDDNLKLIALEGAGVDNWQGYSEAMDSYRELKSEQNGSKS